MLRYPSAFCSPLGALEAALPRASISKTKQRQAQRQFTPCHRCVPSGLQWKQQQQQQTNPAIQMQIYIYEKLRKIKIRRRHASRMQTMLVTRPIDSIAMPDQRAEQS